MVLLGLLANQNLQPALEEMGIKPVEIDENLAEPRPRQKQRRLSPSQITELCEDYLDGASVRMLASDFGIHRTTVLSILERANIPRRPATRKLTDTQVREAAKRYLKGDSLDTVAQRFNVSQRTITKELRAADVQIRPSRRDHPASS